MKNLFSIKLASVLLVVSGLTASGVASADSYNRHVNVINNSSYTIDRIQGSNVGTNDWEEDILGQDILSPGEKVDINFDDDTGYCKFDFLITFDDGATVVESDFNVCTEDHFTVLDP